MEIKRDFTWSEIQILVLIKNCYRIKDLTITTLAKNINISVNNPKYYIVLRYLFDSEAIVVVRIIGRTKFLKINYKLIKNILDEQERINFLVNNYLETDHRFFW